MCLGFEEYRYFCGDKEKVLSQLREALMAEDEILLAIVFGSFTKLECYRDIDLAVYTKHKDFDYILKLPGKLELRLGIPVDVVPLDELPPKFRMKVLTQGIIVVEKVPGLYEALLSQLSDEMYYEEKLD